MTPLQLPKSIGGYEVLRPLASGGMGAVLLGEKVTAQGFKKRVAIKVILPHLLGDAQARALFFDEARLAARFNHPNLVQVYDFGEDEGFFHLIMELVEGASVLSILQRPAENGVGAVDARVAARIVAEAASGLAWAHGLRDDEGAPLHVVHRDISPDNLFVTSSGGTKVLDFGIARSRDRSAVSVVGLVRGKPAYMAPEHLQGDAVDGRADVWSLGVVFVELLTGKRLFTGSGMALARRVLEEPLPPALQQLSSSVPASLAAIAQRMLTRDVFARPTMQEVVAAFESCGEVAAPTAVLPALSSRMSSPSSSSESPSPPSIAARGEDEATAPLGARKAHAQPVDVALTVVDAATPAAVASVTGTGLAPAPRRGVAAIIAIALAAVVVGVSVVVVVGGEAGASIDAGFAAPAIADAGFADAGGVDTAAVVVPVEFVDAGAAVAKALLPKTTTKPKLPAPTTSTPTPTTTTTTSSETAGVFVPDRRPWVDVFVDGKKVGVSPLGSRRKPFVVAAGAHRLRLVDPASGAVVLERDVVLAAGAVEEVR